MENKCTKNISSGKGHEKFCICRNTNNQSDAEVILPDQSRYCMLCGHKKKTKLFSLTGTKDNDNDDVIIVKEEKGHKKGHSIPKTSSNNVKITGVEIAEKNISKNNVHNIVFTTSPNDSSFMKFKLPAAKPKEKMKQTTVSADSGGNNKFDSQVKSIIANPSNSESAKKTEEGKIQNNKANKRKADAGTSKQHTSVKKKISVEKASIEQRKSKRVKKATSRFSDCVTLNLDTESDSSDESDSSSESEGDSDDGYASPLDMLDEENMCKVCMSYEPPIEFEQGCDVASFELKWIDCDGCHQWFHWFCVGIFDENDTQFFKCKTCRSQHV